MSTPLKVGEEFGLHGIAHRVLRVTEGRLLIENVATTQTKEVNAETLLDLYGRGDLIVSTQNPTGPAQLGAKRRDLTSAMLHLSDKGRDRTLFKHKWLSTLTRLGGFRSRRDLQEAYPKAAAELGCKDVPSIPTTYRWRRTWERAGRDPRSVIATFHRRGGAGRTRLRAEVEAIVATRIDDIYLAQRRSSATEVHNAVMLDIHRANQTLIPSQQLKVPSLRTIQQRLAMLCAFSVSVARNGERKSKALYGDTTAARETRRILEVVEIDHTPVDLWVVPEEGGLPAKPELTVVLDRHSRCVLGFFLSLTGHGVDAVFGALRHALLPKTYLKKRYPEVQGQWPCYGFFTTLLADNGSEFIGRSLEAAAFELGVDLQLCAAYDPNNKPFIERFNYTVNHCFFHTLKGTSLSRVSERQGDKLETEACMTLAEVEKLLHIWIVDDYHATPHSGLEGFSPADVWAESSQQFVPRIDLSVAQIDAALSESDNSAIGRGGIDINNNRYNSERLCALRRMLPKKNRVKIKYRRADIGSILVLDEFAQEYFRVPNVKSGCEGMSKEQQTAIRAERRARSSHDPIQVATAESIIRNLSKELHAKRKMRANQKAARLNGVNSDQVRRPKARRPSSTHKPEIPVGLYDDAPLEIPSVDTRNQP